MDTAGCLLSRKYKACLSFIIRSANKGLLPTDAVKHVKPTPGALLNVESGALLAYPRNEGVGKPISLVQE